MDGKEFSSEQVTDGVRIRATPGYLPDQSDPGEPRYVFGYHIDVSNETSTGIQILSRRWRIIEGDGDSHEVVGDGVVGLQPHIAPGESFHYGSFCPLRTEWGTMEGEYLARWDDGRRVELKIARFYLAIPREPNASSPPPE